MDRGRWRESLELATAGVAAGGKPKAALAAPKRCQGGDKVSAWFPEPKLPTKAYDQSLAVYFARFGFRYLQKIADKGSLVYNCKNS
jgi:hypothetical protein